MTDFRRLAGGSRPPSLAIVSTDQVTIVGNGTSEHPLRLGHPLDASVVFVAVFRGEHIAPRKGLPVFVAGESERSGLATVKPASASELATAQVAGIVTDVHGDAIVRVQSAGIVELSVEEWDAVTEGHGGLRPGVTYYLAGAPMLATLTSVAPPTPGVFVSRVGVALTARALFVALPAQPARNLGESTFEAHFVGQPSPVGAAVKVTGPGGVAAASSRSERDAAVVGVLVVVHGSRVVVQTAGIVRLSVPQWELVTKDVEGLVPGARYFVAEEGGLHSSERSHAVNVVAQVGIALSTTELLLSVPSVVGVIVRRHRRRRISTWLHERCWRRLASWLRGRGRH